MERTKHKFKEISRICRALKTKANRTPKQIDIVIIIIVCIEQNLNSVSQTKNQTLIECYVYVLFNVQVVSSAVFYFDVAETFFFSLFI